MSPSKFHSILRVKSTLRGVAVLFTLDVRRLRVTLCYGIDIRLEGIGNRARAPYISMERSAGHSWQLLIG